MQHLVLPLLVVVLSASEPVTRLNVSYDVTREFYKDVNTAFAKTPA